MKSFGIELSDDDKRLPYLYWTPKLHKSPMKHRFIAGSSKCTTKQSTDYETKATIDCPDNLTTEMHEHTISQ